MTEKLVPIDDKGVCGPCVYLLRNLQFLRPDIIQKILILIEENYFRLTEKKLEGAQDVLMIAAAQNDHIADVLNLTFFWSMHKEDVEKNAKIDKYIVPQMLQFYTDKLFISAELATTIRPWLVGTLSSYMTLEQVESSVKTQSLPPQISAKRIELGTRLVQLVPNISSGDFKLFLHVLREQTLNRKTAHAQAAMIQLDSDDRKDVLEIASLLKNVNSEFQQLIADYCSLCAMAGDGCYDLSQDIASKMLLFQKKYFPQ